MITENIIELVVDGLKDLANEVVFVGGAFVNFYSTDKAAGQVRPTDDIDCAVEVIRLSEYNNFEYELRKHGFKNDIDENAPICRYVFKGVKIDFIPTEENILGFLNKWYAEGFKNAVYYELSNGVKIKIFNSVYFLASKLDAFWDRGRKDLRLSIDFEDIVFLLDSRKEIRTEIDNSGISVKTYIREKFKYLILHPDINEGILCSLPPGTGATRMNRIKEIMTDIAAG